MRIKFKNKKTGAKIFAFLTSLALLLNEGAGLIISATPSQEELDKTGKVFKLVSSSVMDETDATYAPTYKNGTIQYNPNDPLGVATRFHLFSDGTVKNNIHTNGNMAVSVLNQGANSGTQGFQGEVTYIRSFENYNNKVFGDAEGSVPGTLVVGSVNEITLTDNGNYFAINGTKVNDFLNNMYQDTETDKFIDLESEMSAYKNLSKKLPTATSARSYTEVATVEGAKRIIALNMASGCDVINIGADDAADFLSASEIVLSEYELGTADYGNNSVVFNVDLSKCSSAVTVPKIMLQCKGKTNTESHGHRTTFEYGNILWNFYDSSKTNGAYVGTISTNNFWGTILAPGADVTLGSNIDGNIIAHNITINAESHRNDFRGLLPTSYSTENPSTKTGSLEIKVTDQSGVLVQGTVVTLTKTDGTTEDITLDTGITTLNNIPTGDYSVEIKQLPAGYKEVISTDTAKVEEHQTAKMEVTAQQVGSLKVIVKEENSSTKVGNVTVTITGTD